MIRFILNDTLIQTNQPPGLTLLDFIRYHRHLKGTKTGCREGDCGACAVLIGENGPGGVHYQSMTSCLTPLANVQGKHVVTVEGINGDGLNPVQNAIVEEGGTQCGFCTVGFVMSLTGFTLSPAPANKASAIAAMDGNICRCTGYKSLERAADRIVEQLQQAPQPRLPWLVENGFLPEYFGSIEKRLTDIAPAQKTQNPQIRVGGGTDLYVQRPEHMVHTEADWLFDNHALKGITKTGNTYFMGAAVTVEDLRKSSLINALFPNLHNHLKLVSSTPIRNMATLAGNFVNASPIGDMTIFFLALHARIILKNGSGNEREIALKDLYAGYKKLTKEADEHIHKIFFEAPSPSWVFNFEKVCKRTHLDIASVNSGFFADVDDLGQLKNVGVSMGGVFAYPKFLDRTAAHLEGKKPSEKLIREALSLIQEEIAPISDARGEASYKRRLAQQLFLAHIHTCFPNAIPMDAFLPYSEVTA